MVTDHRSTLSGQARRVMAQLHLPYADVLDASALINLAQDIRLVTHAEAELIAADLDATGDHALVSSWLTQIEDHLRNIVCPRLTRAPELLGMAPSLQAWIATGFPELPSMTLRSIAAELEAISVRWAVARR